MRSDSARSGPGGIQTRSIGASPGTSGACSTPTIVLQSRRDLLLRIEPSLTQSSNREIAQGAYMQTESASGPLPTRLASGMNASAIACPNNRADCVALPPKTLAATPEGSCASTSV